MARDTTRVLVVCADRTEAAAIRDMLPSGTGPATRAPEFVATTAYGVDEAVTALGAQPSDVVVLCLQVSAPEALDALVRIRELGPQLPIVVILDRDDERLAVQAAEFGAQECIAREELVGNLLARSLHYAVERQDLLGQLERRSVMDDLTGLYNRRGFFALGEQEWKRARRRSDGFLLMYADLDGLKAVNDRLGHEVGDAMIRDAATLLSAVFRGGDILARLGGDEFAVIAQRSGPGDLQTIRDRIQREIAALRKAGKLTHDVSLSLGIVGYTPATEPTVGLDQLLSRADAAMYEDKQRRKKSRPADGTD